MNKQDGCNTNPEERAAEARASSEADLSKLRRLDDNSDKDSEEDSGSSSIAEFTKKTHHTGTASHF